MREIKFRAWDKLKSEMIYSGIEYELRCLSNPKYDKGYESDTIGFINNNESHFDIEQYTGLKDNNGKEIYEGDICLSSMKAKFIVEWIVSGYNGVFSFSSRPLNIMSIDKCEIIGNIHENPKLIK